MKSDHIYDRLLPEIRKKIPKNSELVSTLTNILFIEKEAVYRRLRNEVPFTFQEVVIISKQLDISLDNMIGINTNRKRPFLLQMPDFLTPQEIDYKMIEELTVYLNAIKLETDTEMGTISSILPESMYCGFKNITQYYLFKWHYHYTNNTPSKAYHDIIAPEKVSESFRHFFDRSKNMKKTYFILDSQTFQYLVNDIKYFNSIRLIKKEDIANIKQDLERFLDYMEKIATTGKYEETGNQVLFYISDINIDTGYSYIQSHNNRASLIWTFLLDSAVSFDEKTFTKMKTWFKSMTRTSTLISVSGEKPRILFFEKQRKIISEL